MDNDLCFTFLLLHGIKNDDQWLAVVYVRVCVVLRICIEG